MQPLIYLIETVFLFWHDASLSHMIERAENMLCSLNILFLGGRDGESSAILLALISIHSSRHYFHCFLLSINLIKFCFVG